jgi:hypothetical protein
MSIFFIKAWNDAVPIHRLMLHLEALILGNPVQRLDVKPVRNAVLVHKSKRRKVRIDAVDVNLFL